MTAKMKVKSMSDFHTLTIPGTHPTSLLAAGAKVNHFHTRMSRTTTAALPSPSRAFGDGRPQLQRTEGRVDLASGDKTAHLEAVEKQVHLQRV